MKEDYSRNSNLLGQSERIEEKQQMREPTFWQIRLFQI